MKEIIGKRDNF